MNDYRISVIDTREGFESLALPWNKLLVTVRCELCLPFMGMALLLGGNISRHRKTAVYHHGI